MQLKSCANVSSMSGVTNRSLAALLAFVVLACNPDEGGGGLRFDLGTPDDAGPVDMDAPSDGGPDDGGADGGTGLQPPFTLPESPCAEGVVPLAPAILAPVPGTATEGPFQTSASLTVECRASELAVEEVVIRQLIAPGVPAARNPAVSNEGDLFRATFNLADEPNGFIAFDCLAQGQTPGGEEACGYAQVSTWLDLGPEVRVASPAPNAFLRGPVMVRFDVVPIPFIEAGDDAALVEESGIAVRAAGQPLTLTSVDRVDPDDPTAGLRVVVQFDLGDEMLFPDGIDGERELEISATNGRGATRTVIQTFTVDNQGPEISILEPESGELVGGLVTVRAEITDPAGVALETIELRIPDEDPRPFAEIPGSPNEFRATFDASVYGIGDPSIVLNVTATDNNGNSATATQNIRLDSVPPIASLDPVDVRVVQRSGVNVRCSLLFDPVGSDSVNDGEIIGPQAEFRARIEDRGNESLGDGVVVFVSGVARAELFLFQPTDAMDRPLVIGPAGGGTCDDINPDVRPESSMPDPATVVELLPVRPAGSPRGDESDISGAGEPASAYAGGAIYADCNRALGTAATPERCEESSPLTQIISTVQDRSVSAIYAPGPIGGVTCVGSEVNLNPIVTAGRYACAAVRVEDELGNVSVSHPVRFCVENAAGGCAAERDAGDLPVCTDGCGLPQTFRDLPPYQRVDP